MTRNFDLLVFDWDGTLMDSEAKIVGAVHAAAADLGLEAPPTDAVRNIIGLGLQEANDILFPGQDLDFHRQVAERYRHHFLEALQIPVTLFPGTREVLEKLTLEGYLLAVATGKSRAGLARELELHELSGTFDATRCADEAASKPHPQMLEEIMTELGANPERTLMVGDTEYDLRMARDAGAHGMAVSYGAHEASRLLEFHPLAVLGSISELPPWLETGTPALEA